MLALVSLAIVEADDGTVATARQRPSEPRQRAVVRPAGLSRHRTRVRGRARTATDPGRPRRRDSRGRAGATGYDHSGLAYVLTSCGDTLLDLGDGAGEALLDEAREVIARCPDPGIAGRYLTRAERAIT